MHCHKYFFQESINIRFSSFPSIRTGKISDNFSKKERYNWMVLLNIPYQSWSEVLLIQYGTMNIIHNLLQANNTWETWLAWLRLLLTKWELIAGWKGMASVQGYLWLNAIYLHAVYHPGPCLRTRLPFLPPLAVIIYLFLTTLSHLPEGNRIFCVH